MAPTLTLLERVRTSLRKRLHAAHAHAHTHPHSPAGAHGQPLRRPASARSHARHRIRRATLVAYSLYFLVATVALGVLYVGQAIFVPIALALLLALVLSGPVEVLHRLGIRRSLGATLLLLAMFSLVLLGVHVLWEPARAWIAAAPETFDRVEEKVGPLAQVLERVVLGVGAEAVAAHSAGASRAQELAMHASGTLLGATPSALIATVTVVMLAFFLVSGGAPTMARLAIVLSHDAEQMETLRVVEAVRHEVARYYAALALINLSLGVATAAMTWLLGLPNPLLWGTMAMMLNFIPYAGSAVTLFVLTMVSFATFDSLGHVLLVVGSFLVIVTIEGQIAEPLFIGRRLQLSPAVVFLALWLGGWFWGIPGVILAIPALVALKVVAEHRHDGRLLLELLSPGPSGPFELLRLRSLGQRGERHVGHVDAPAHPGAREAPDAAPGFAPADPAAGHETP